MNKFQVELIQATLNPQRLIYAALHQDYSEELVVEHCQDWPKEKKSGEIVVKRLLAGDRGHFGCLEHPTITLNCGYFPHSVMQQIRSHRIISIDCQSNRYTGDRIIDVFIGVKNVESVFYLRPVGSYTDRQGQHYEYTQKQRNSDLDWCLEATKKYSKLVNEGVAKEQARGIIPFDIRQHWVMSLNMRSLMHLLDMRWKKDAQLECQKFCSLIWPHFQTWAPEIAKWYMLNRAKKAKLAP